MSPLLNIHQQSCKGLLHFGYNSTRILWESTITKLHVSKQADKPNIEDTQQRAFFAFFIFLVVGSGEDESQGCCNLQPNRKMPENPKKTDV